MSADHWQWHTSESLPHSCRSFDKAWIIHVLSQKWVHPYFTSRFSWGKRITPSFLRDLWGRKGEISIDHSWPLTLIILKIKREASNSFHMKTKRVKGKNDKRQEKRKRQEKENKHVCYKMWRKGWKRIRNNLNTFIWNWMKTVVSNEKKC